MGISFARHFLAMTTVSPMITVRITVFTAIILQATRNGPIGARAIFHTSSSGRGVSSIFYYLKRGEIYGEKNLRLKTSGIAISFKFQETKGENDHSI